MRNDNFKGMGHCKYSIYVLYSLKNWQFLNQEFPDPLLTWVSKS